MRPHGQVQDNHSYLRCKYENGSTRSLVLRHSTRNCKKRAPVLCNTWRCFHWALLPRTTVRNWEPPPGISALQDTRSLADSMLTPRAPAVAHVAGRRPTPATWPAAPCCGPSPSLPCRGPRKWGYHGRGRCNARRHPL